MFSDLNDFLEENELSQNIVKQSILNNLQDLTLWFDKSFPEDTIRKNTIGYYHPSPYLVRAISQQN